MMMKTNPTNLTSPAPIALAYATSATVTAEREQAARQAFLRHQSMGANVAHLMQSIKR